MSTNRTKEQRTLNSSTINHLIVAFFLGENAYFSISRNSKLQYELTASSQFPQLLSSPVVFGLNVQSQSVDLMIRICCCCCSCSCCMFPLVKKTKIHVYQNVGSSLWNVLLLHDGKYPLIGATVFVNPIASTLI